MTGDLRCESRLMWAHGVRARCTEPPHSTGDHHSGIHRWTDEEAEQTVERFGPPKRGRRPWPPLSPRIKAATLAELLVEVELRLTETPGPQATRLALIIRSALIKR